MALLYAQIAVIEEQEEEERRMDERLFRRHVRDAQGPFSISEIEFRNNFRLSKEACLYLMDTLIPHMDAGRGAALRIPNNMRILTALNFFAVGSYQRSVGNNLLACISQPMVSRCIKEVSNVLIRHCIQQWIRFPRNDNQKQELAKLQCDHRMHNIIGIVDGTHVAIVTPAVDEHVFVNRKGYHSINVQIICDARMKIISCLARYPGSTHDSFVWRNSTAGRAMRANYENGDENSIILGDSSYPCLPWLFVPLSRIQTDQERRYNSRVKRVRSTVERCIGLLKGRFRCLLKDRTLHYEPRNAVRIILACAILHNISIHYNAEEPEPVLDDIDLNVSVAAENDAIYRQLGQAALRQYIADNF